MNNKMDDVIKKISFSYLEYQVLAELYEVADLICFEFKSDDVCDKSIQELYNQGIFELYKHGILESNEDTFYIIDEIKEIFEILKKSIGYMIVECKKSDISNYCIYFTKEDSVIVAQPGMRNNEYVLLSIITSEMLVDFFYENGLLEHEFECEYTSNLGRESMYETVIGENGDNMFDVEQFKTRFTVNRLVPMKIIQISIVTNKLYDEIVIREGKRIMGRLLLTVRNMRDVIEDALWRN